MKRFTLFVILGFAPLWGAQAEGHAVAVVTAGKSPVYSALLGGFKQYLAKAGVKCRIDLLDETTGDLDRARGAVSKYELVLAFGSDAAAKAKEEFAATPLLFSLVYDPEKYGLIESAQHPGKNATGVTLTTPPAKQLEVLLAALPRAKTIGVFYSAQSKKDVDEALGQAARLGIKIVSAVVTSDYEIPQAFKELTARNKIDAIWLNLDSVVCTVESIKFILINSAKAMIPVLGFNNNIVKAGAAVGYGYDYRDMGAQLGEQAVQILGGKPAGEIAVEAPRKLKWLVNKRIAEGLNLAIPAAIAAQAETIE